MSLPCAFPIPRTIGRRLGEPRQLPLPGTRQDVPIEGLATVEGLQP